MLMWIKGSLDIAIQPLFHLHILVLQLATISPILTSSPKKPILVQNKYREIIIISELLCCSLQL